MSLTFQKDFSVLLANAPVLLNDTTGISERTLDYIPVPTFLLTCNEDGAIRYKKLNAIHEATIGIPSTEIAGKTPHEFFPRRLADTLLQNYTKCRDIKQPIIYEEQLDLKSGEHWWKTTLAPIVSPSGDVTHIMGSAIDITAEKHKEMQALATLADMSQLVEDTNVFTSLAAHDIRAPLRQIKSAGALVEKDFEDLGDNKLPLIQLINSVSDKALNYVDRLLNYTKTLMASRTTLERTELDHVLADLFALIDPVEQIAIEWPKGYVLETETTVFQIILRNLADNAVKAGCTAIRVGITETDKEGYLQISVSDNGSGFAGGQAAFDERIATAKTNLSFNGFGLAGVSHLVTARKGKLTLETPEFKGGTTIAFTLPAIIISELKKA